ncbi:MAG: chemotaxis protein CheB, partial [Myxococcaceae bacterium]
MDTPKGDAAAPAPERFPIVGIGASAGGLEALEQLIRRLSPERSAYVVVQHLAPGHEHVLADLLAGFSALPVVAVKDGMKIERAHIYVAPPGADLALHNATFHLMPQPEARRARLPIDYFFRSLATDQDGAAIGVILSGAGTDGTLGLKAIKDEGGITFVQAPATATQYSMPQSALDSGYADYCLPPPEIGDELMRLVAHPFVAAAAPRLFAPEHLNKLVILLRNAFGVDFANYKQATVERRVERRMVLHKLERLEDYVMFVTSDPNELRSLYNDLLIGVTGFFRDKEPFEALKTAVFPRLLEGRERNVPVRIWVVGCSTGEEAYSIGICLLEYLSDSAAGRRIQLFATDIDERAIDRARDGIYPRNIELDVSPERLQRFFSVHERGYQVGPQLRDMLIFAHHNVATDPPFSRIDLVSCRNVLIYMQAPMQKKALRTFHYALNPDAFLLLGTSESVGESIDLFSVVDRKLKLFQKKNVRPAAMFEFPLRTRAATTVEAVPPHYRTSLTPQQVADRKVMEKYAPPGVVVDERLEIVQFRGRTGPFLEPVPGAATLNLLKLALPELLLELKAAIGRALRDNEPVTTPPVRLREGRGLAAVSLDVMPLAEPGAGGRSVLVLFNEVPLVPAPGGAGPEALPPPDARVQDLERELATVKDQLQSNLDEMALANEDLQASNEELQSSNEELQSTNEELETSKEELQSTNEELTTVNEELQTRMGQLAVSNDDLRNVLSNLSSALVIVGSDLRIRRFSQAAEKLLNLSASDLGRPVSYLNAFMKARSVEETVAEAVSDGNLRTQGVRLADGHWYTMRIVPYQTEEHVVRGAIIEFVTTPTLRRPGEAGDIHEFADEVLSAVTHPLMLLDSELRLVWVNRSFFETFQL